MVELNEVFKKEETEYLKTLYDGIGRMSRVGDAGYAVYTAIGNILERRRRTPPKPKGIDIEMTCGESHHIDTEQPTIESIKLNGEQIYPSTDKCCEPETISKTRTLKAILEEKFPPGSGKRAYRVQVIEDTSGYVDGNYEYPSKPDHKGGAIIDIYERGTDWIIQFHPEQYSIYDGGAAYTLKQA